MKIIGEIEINKATLSAILIALAFIIVVVITTSTFEVFQTEEYKAYKDAHRKRTIPALETYLRAYPDGKFVGRIQTDLEGLYGNEYRKCLSFMDEQVQKCQAIARDYQMAMIRAGARREDPTAVVESMREDMEIKGTFKELVDANAGISNYMQYGAFNEGRYRDIHDAMLDAYQAYLKLYQLSLAPLETEGDYQEAVSNAFNTYISFKMSANMMIVNLGTQLVKENTGRLLKAKGIKRKGITDDQ